MAVAVVLVIYFVSQAIGQAAVVGVYTSLRHVTAARAESLLSSSVAAQFFYILLVEVITFGLLYLFIHRRKISLQALGLIRPRLRDPLLSLAALPVYFGVYLAVLTAATKLFPSLNVNQQQQIGFQQAHSGLNLVLTFVSLVVLPPLVEETMMRGFLFGSLKKGLPVVWAALITSVMFAAAHLQFGSGAPLLWVAAIDTFTLSLVLCFLRHKTGSLWPGIGLHALKNFVAFASIFLLHMS